MGDQPPILRAPWKRWGPGSAEGRMTAIAACRTCGTEPLENARFCHGCGSPVQDGDTHAEYKQVTVLFADVVHSMDIAAAVGPESLREIMLGLVDRASAVVQRFGGTVDKFTGDGIMAVFGAPTALEDHALRACLASLGIQDEVKRLAVEVERHHGVDLQLRVGLNSGEVIAGEIGSGAMGYTAIGEQVGMAQRMESVAPPGGVMLSASTARLVEGAAVLGEPEMVHIKGVKDAVPARQLLGMASQPATDMFVETLLTRGGEADLQEAQTAIERLAAAPNHEMVDREILLLRARALLAGARGDEAAHRDLLRQHRVMATRLGRLGYMATADSWTLRAAAAGASRLLAASARMSRKPGWNKFVLWSTAPKRRTKSDPT